MLLQVCLGHSGALMEDVRCKIVSWEEVEDWADKLSEKIKKGFKPDIVIGLTRGGWVPARLICDRLKIKNLLAVKTEHWGLTATKDGKAKLVHGIGMDIEGKNILVIDDITDTGQSLALAIEHIKEKNPKEIKSATLLHITHSNIIPDFYVVEVPKEEWTWFIFPWNFNEDIRNFVEKASNHSKETNEIKELLKKHCQIDVDERVIEKTLGSIKS